MLTKLSVQNFRSIESCDVEFAPITIFFGPTSAGKSTLLYALLVLRNFILHRQILPDLLVEEQQIASERAEAPHPLPVRVDGEAIVKHTILEPSAVPLKPPTDYPGWAELYGPDAKRAGKQGEPGTTGSVPLPGAGTGPELHAADAPEEMPAAALAAALGGNNGSGPAT